MQTDSTLSAQFDFFRLHKLSLSCRQTVYQYELNLRRFDEYLGRPALIADLQDPVVSAALVWLTREKRLSPATASKFRDNLCCLWRFLARKRIVDTDPDVPEIKEPRRVPIALTRDQLKLLWEFLQRLPGSIAGIPAADWFTSLVAAFWDTGARKGEIFGMRTAHLDLRGGFMVAKAETVKGGMEDRLYRIRPSTVDLILRIYDPRREFVWPWPWSESIFYDRLGEIMLKNGLPDDRYHKTHILRKSVATHLLVEGGNPQQALGHSTAAMTRAYVDPRIAPPPSPIDRLWEIGK
jgi:integrase